MENLLAVQELKVDFIAGKDIITAVDCASFEIKKNEVVVLAGESGSGKTVSALSLTRIIPSSAKITQGRVFFEGKDLLRMDESSLVDIRGKEIAYVFQEPVSFLNPVYSIGDQIAEVVRLHQGAARLQARLQAMELLDMVKINDPARVMTSYPHQLSGGMNQRAFIAMALACKPKLLIADEPTTSLDVTVEAQILRLLLELKDKFGFSMLFITHNLSIARKIAEKIYIMYKGKIVESGDRESIFNAPGQIHTKELISAYEKIGKI